jgi:hypothetical protein
VVNASLPIVGTRRTTVTSLMVLLAIITPASSGTRQAAVPAEPAGRHATVWGGVRLADLPGDEARGDVQLADEQYDDTVLLASRVYEGIDLIVREAGEHAAYGFAIRPYARANRIRLSMSGAERLEIDEDGDLLVHRGGRSIRQQRPRAHQDTPGGPVEINVEYRVGPDGDVRFAVGRYDRSRALIIHPMLTFPTRLTATAAD